MERINDQKSMLIVGPCSGTNRGEIIQTAKNALARGITHVRTTLVKPRTEPDYEGIGLKSGIPLLAEVASMGLVPCTEVLDSNQARSIVEGVENLVPNAQMMIWLGARNQNQVIQRQIGKMIEERPNISLMIKNPAWASFKHWKGSFKHSLTHLIDENRETMTDAQLSEIVSTRSNRLIACHRGVDVAEIDIALPEKWVGLRNIPTWETARNMVKVGLPVIIDPSHMAGKVANIERVLLESVDEGIDPLTNGWMFNGFIIEVHPNPTNARTDKDQALTWDQYDHLMEKVNSRFKERGIVI